jgi:hypothetical protein
LFLVPLALLLLLAPPLPLQSLLLLIKRNMLLQVDLLLALAIEALALQTLLLLALAQRLVATSFFELLLLLLFSPALGFLAPPLFLPALLLLQCVLGLLLIKRQRGKSRVDGFLPRRLNQCWLCRSRPHMRRLTWRPLPILSLLIGMLHQCCPLGVGNLG